VKNLGESLMSTWLGSMLFRSSESLYVRLSRNVFFLVLIVAVVPSLIQSMTAHFQSQKIIEQEQRDHLVWRMRYGQESVDHFLEKHVTALRFLFESHSIEEFNDQQILQYIFSELKKGFPNFVDLGLIDATGLQVTYDGPYKLHGENYHDELWFQEVVVRGRYISDVFWGRRHIPHMAIAIKSSSFHNGEFWVLRATIDAEVFDKMVSAMNCGKECDTFIINKSGFLQNTSRFHGSVLSRLELPMPPSTERVMFTEGNNARDQKSIIASIGLTQLDWTLALVQPLSEKQAPLFALQRRMTGIGVISFLTVLLVAMWMTRNFAGRLREAEQEHEAILHMAEHSSKLASIGRLAAGVAHEINNPMAIINEKAGLMKDLTELSDDFANKERFLEILQAIQTSVVRCRAVTHRLLGFARQMDVTPEVIDVNAVIREVLGFLEKEAFHRDVRVELDLSEDLPTIHSDRGQLQQVFLNLLNNGMDAVGKGGEISIKTWVKDKDTVGVRIRDNGCGIPPDRMKRIFEPFFTTKEVGKGTGLGLSITYGIINKLGGKVSVESEVDKGTTFDIEIPRESRL
jgi:two-component system NtrC family sensor kinase